MGMRPCSVNGIEFDALINESRSLTAEAPEYAVESGFFCFGQYQHKADGSRDNGKSHEYACYLAGSARYRESGFGCRAAREPVFFQAACHGRHQYGYLSEYGHHIAVSAEGY